MMHTTYRKDRAGRLLLLAAARRKRRFRIWRGIGKDENGIVSEHAYMAREPYAVLVQEAAMLVRRLNDVYLGVRR
jgi:hypothetical protein